MKKIKCGIKRVNKRFRIPLTIECKDNDIVVGDHVRVWIEKVVSQEDK